MKLKVIKIKCPKCGKEAEAVNIHEDFTNKATDRTEGRHCFNCRYFEVLDLEKKEKTLKLI